MDASLRETEYDVLLVGTGMVEGILAGALARIGKKVLHLDQNDYYGSNYASFPLAQFRRWMKHEPIAPRDDDDAKTGLNASPSNATGTFDIKTHRVLPMHQSFQCHLLYECFATDATKTELLHQSSSFSIDVTPRLLLSSEQLVETLITSGVGRYLEFAAIERTYVHLSASDSKATAKSGEHPSWNTALANQESDTVWPVPCSKKDVFQSKLLGMVEKRQLMKFLQFVADYGDTHILHEDIATKNERSLAVGRALKRPQNKLNQVDKDEPQASNLDKSFYELLTHSFHLSTKLQQVIVYCVGLATFPLSTLQLSAREGLVAVYRYVASIGRFATTAFLAPLYGISELAQSFCRLSAVYGGIYVLRAPIDAFVLDLETNTVSGVRATDGTLFRAKQIVANGTYAPCLRVCGMATKIHNQLLRGVFVLRSSLRHGVNRLMLVIPPDDSEFRNPFAIQVIQLDVGVYACPKGYVLVQLSTPLSPEWCHDKERLRNLMQMVIQRLIQSAAAEEKGLSTAERHVAEKEPASIVWQAIFTVDHLTCGGKEPRTHIPLNVWVGETSNDSFESDKMVHPLEMHLENASATARAIFEAMCPGESFLPKSASAEQAEQEEQESDEETVLRAAQQLVQQTHVRTEGNLEFCKKRGETEGTGKIATDGVGSKSSGHRLDEREAE